MVTASVPRPLPFRRRRKWSIKDSQWSLDDSSTQGSDAQEAVSMSRSPQSGHDRSASNSARRRREGADRSATVEQNDRNQATDDGRPGRFDAATRRVRGTEEEGRSRPRCARSLAHVGTVGCAAPCQVEPLCPLMPRLEPPSRVTLHESVRIPLVASVWRLASERDHTGLYPISNMRFAAEHHFVVKSGAVRASDLPRPPPKPLPATATPASHIISA